ncbi:uncharacterized protein BDZ99DRAFT_467335 [Mytilinidion resinicola]|uniref:Guanine nucleotide exchange factor n=1 Tax=Mytilinidion resinicola TaxID=574789 RepID=A0A6A6Y7X0_9PEZI|nr:uncharacterized protein BDZ99DRAFT_467335 [Mytilinidion resinicola]KAF2804648.1 hypothetical protein BDZ99DRAFT_467335 [Mytilinidion resinicola]
MAPATKSSAMTPSSGKAKLEQVTSILATLKTDLEQTNLLPHQRNTLLEELKVHGRAAENADPIFARNGIEILARYGFESSNSATSREALRCLANALLLQPKTRQMFVDLGFGDKAAEKAKSDNTDDEFLISRILFLLTYDSDLDFDSLVRSHQLAESINAAIARHARRYSKSSRHLSYDNPMSMNTMALSETLKLLFNITHHYPDLQPMFTKSIPHIFKILVRHKIPSPPLEQPVNYLINALLNLDLEEGDKTAKSFSHSAVFPKFDAKCNAEHLINILDQAISVYPEAQLDRVAPPVLTLIRRVYEIAPDAVQTYMQWLLLPTDDERTRPLGKSDTLSARLLRLSTSAMLPTLRGNISSMLFELSGKDAAKFVHNVGYGFASGFLLSHNIAMPESAMDAYANGTEGAEKGGVPVNPITGQRLDAEEEEQGPPMTREEKEREAERLFVLFERLKATGVMNVENPVARAVQEGRFEELDDDADE